MYHCIYICGRPMILIFVAFNGKQAWNHVQWTSGGALLFLMTKMFYSLSLILKIPVFPQFFRFKIQSSMTFIFSCITPQNIAITFQSLNGFIDEKLNKGSKQRRSSFFVLRDQAVSLLLFRPKTVTSSYWLLYPPRLVQFLHFTDNLRVYVLTFSLK